MAEIHSGAGTPLRDLVLIGGGHAHVQVLRHLAMKPVAGLRVTVVSREIHTPYSGMLPGLIAGHYSWDDIHIDLAPLCARAGARLFSDTVAGLDLKAQALHCPGRPPVRFDVLSINCGSSPDLGSIAGAADLGVPVKPISQFLPRWEALLGRIRQSHQPVNLAIVGGGAGGVELALAIQYRLRRVEQIDRVRINLVEAADTLMPGHGVGVRRRLQNELASHDITVHCGVRVSHADEGGLRLPSGDTVAADEVMWVTQAGAQSWLSESGLAVDESGFVRTNTCLQSVSHPAVFAAGDVASLDGHKLAKSGVYAVRQGPVLTHNLISTLCSRPLKTYRPQRRFLSLISTGDQRAVASRGRFAACGAWVWRGKDWIDRRFMARFALEDHDMSRARPKEQVADPVDAKTDNQMRCGGCGSKLGKDMLHRVLSRLEVDTHPDAIKGIGDDAAVLRPVAHELELQTLDGFRAMLDDPYLLGRIAAEHAMNDVFAMGGVVRTALAWATVPYAAEHLMEDDLYQLMSGALRALHGAGGTLVGGHSGEGMELSVGIAVTGTVAEHQCWTKDKLAVNDRLVLTKPIGTGAIFAAHMAARCQGRWLTSALASMQQSNGKALPALSRAGAQSITDVTGFGLLGHAGEMAAASRVKVEIWPELVPALPGAVELMKAGVFSSLQLANEQDLLGADLSGYSAADARIRLLCDPQTSGGLLVGIAPDQTDACIKALRTAGFPHAVAIGQVVRRTDDTRWAIFRPAPAA